MNRILVYHNASLGDTIVALPSLKLIRQTFKSSTIFLLTAEHNNVKATQAQKILTNTNLVDGYILLHANGKTLSKIISLRSEIQQFNPDALIYLNEPRNLLRLVRDYIMFKLFGIKKIFGIQFQKKNRSVAMLENGHYENISHFLARKISKLGAIDFSDQSNLILDLTKEEEFNANQILSQLNISQPIICISVGTKFASNHWGYDRWEIFLHLLSEKYPNHYLIAIGSTDEFEWTNHLLKPWANRSLNLCGTLSVRGSAAVLARCIIYIGHDSGPIHLSNSVGVPCVGIYSSRNLPGIWFPSGQKNQILYTKINCQGCQLSICHDKKNRCIRLITPEAALAAVEKVLMPENLFSS